jgi:SPP1 gp7 family putative phage head morphogenesis protein
MAVNANTQIYDSVVDRAAMIRLYERRVNNKVTLVIDGHVVRLDTLVREAKLSDKGLLRLREAVDQELRGTYRQVFNTTKRSLLDLAADQVSYAYQTVETNMGSIWRTRRPQRRVAEELVLTRPLFGDRTLDQGWARVAADERRRIEAIIRRGVALGVTPDQLALDIRKGNIHNITRVQSKALVITAITSVHAQADQTVYEANKGAIVGWQYVAVLDSRTTPLCAHRDGTIYPPEDTVHLPPAHYRCRSTTTPVFKSWEDIGKLEGVAEVRRRNLNSLTPEQRAFYDGQTPLRETYDSWLRRQPTDVQIRHLGDYKRVELFQQGQLPISKFSNPEGNSIGIKGLRALSDSTYTPPGDTRRFAAAKTKLDAMQLGASTPEDLFSNAVMRRTLVDYYELQAGELDGVLANTNYRGIQLNVKAATKRRVLSTLPTEDQLKYNPITGRYEDVRMYQPHPAVLENNLRLVRESAKLTAEDKSFIEGIVQSLDGRMGINQRAVVADNLRTVFSRFRANGEPWGNLKAVLQAQVKFDVMNVSDFIETQIRKDSDLLKKLLQDNYIDPVLGPVQLDNLHDNFIKNILRRNRWEDTVAPKIAQELKPILDREIPLVIRSRLSERELQQFYLRFSHRLALADSPDRDMLAVALGRDLYNLANLNGNRKSWYETGMKILESPRASKFFELETFGVQKRRMKSRLSNNYFGPYYDTLSYNLRIVDPRIQEYARLQRRVDLGLRVAVTDAKNRLIVREGYKTYFIDRGVLGLEDTRIPITSTSSFSDFPVELVDKNLVDALNWAARTEYRIDEDFYDFTRKLLYFEDDRGRAKYFNGLNTYRKFISSRGDAYERFKAMEWLRASGKSFSNNPFVDHRARIYDRGLIGPQSGETFRPFLNTSVARDFSPEGFDNLQDQIGGFLGGLDDFFEGNYNSLSFTGRQAIAKKWRPQIVELGNRMLSAKPADIRAILESEFVARIEGEDLGKFLRFAIESAKIDRHLAGDYSRSSLEALRRYKIALALEQDASSSGAQIIALTTKNKQLAELSNVIPTTQKKRLYDEIAAATFNDPRFKVINERLGLNERDLRKAAKAQNMVTFYGAGERTGVLNVEGKLAKVLGKDADTLVVTASEREAVLDQISARIARFERFDPVTANELRVLRNDVKDVFNKGLDPGDDLMEQLYFLDPKTRDLVEKLSGQYDRVVTPNDFKLVASIMSEHLAEQVPILKDFTKFFGRLAETYLATAKPSSAAFDWTSIIKRKILGSKRRGYTLPDEISRLLGLKAGEPVSEQVLRRFGFWKPNSNLSQLIAGVEAPAARRTGAKYLKLDFFGLKTINEVEVLYANKLPKRWTNVPWSNFDGKIVEQNFTQVFEERLAYRDKNGNWITNILQVPQKTEATWWEELINKSGKINDIADSTKARTAFAVNGNHSNDATIVKQFHLWGKANGVPTSTIHDAFFTNAADMLEAKQALRQIYARALKGETVKKTLDEMLARGLPRAEYDKYLAEAIEKGIIPIEGKSRVGGKLLTKEDILTTDDVLQAVPPGFLDDYGWYGVG